MFLLIAEAFGYEGIFNLFRYITFRAGGRPRPPWSSAC